MGMMSIRAIGSPTASVGSIASAYVDYLTSGISSKGELQVEELDGTVSYYDSGIEGPGVWSGHGAEQLGLGGFIEPDDLKTILAGRHHETGERLLSAQGSAGRYSLKVGAPTREIDGAPVRSRHDLQGHLKLDGEPFDELLDELSVTFVNHEDILYVDAEAVALINEHKAQGRGVSVGPATRQIDGAPVWSVTDLEARLDLDPDAFEGLLSTVTGDLIQRGKQTYLSEHQVDSLANAVDDLARLDHLRNLKPDTLVSTGDAAELVGVSRRYLQKVIAHHHDYEDRSVAQDERDKDWLPAQKFDPENPNSHWRIRADDLAGFIERRQPPAVRIAYDVTFTFEKSISVVGLLSGGEDRDAFTRAVQAANQAGIDYLDHNASDGRHLGKRIHSEGLTVASFIHSTSRNDDPFVHVHNLVINAVQDENGTGRALDARNLYMQSPSASALASAELRWQLSNTLGVQWRTTGSSVEIDGVSEAVIDEFSTGRNRIQSIVDEAGLNPNDPKARDIIQRESRPDKTGDSPDDMLPEWWDRAQRHGLTPQHLHQNVLGHNEPLPAPRLTDSELDDLHNWLASREGATRNASIFTKGDLLRTIGEWTPKGHDHVRIMPAAEMNRVADAFLTSPHVVPLALDPERVAQLAGKTTAKMQHSEVFSTSRMLELQDGTNAMWENGLNAELSIVPEDTLATALANVPTISKAQAHLVTQWTTSGHQFQSAVGVPGAGKTFAVSAAARAWEAAGYKVIGAAVAGTAAQHLGQDAQIPSETLAYYLTQIDTYGKSPFDAKTILIVDEAGTIPDEDLSRLLRNAVESGATVRFLGDPEQHGAVNAGGMWSHLTETHIEHTPQLLESYRFKDSPPDVEFNELLRDNKFDEALDLLREGGNLIETGSESEALAASLRKAVLDRDNSRANPMIERRNSSRIVLNEALQHVRVQRGEVTNLTTYGQRQYGIGDEIVSRQNSRQLHPEDKPDEYLRNGTKGVITNITNDGTAIADFGQGPIHIDPEILATKAFQLGYSITSYGVQGGTFPGSNSHSSPGASKAEVLVNMSRGTQDNHLIISGNSDEEYSQFFEPDDRGLATQLVESMPASENVPAAIADIGANERTIDLGALQTRLAAALAAEPDPERPDFDPAIEIRKDIKIAKEDLSRRTLAAPPPALTQSLPPRPTVPHLAHRYDNALVAAATYYATYQPDPGNGPWGELLGHRPNELDDGDPRVKQYHQTVNQLVDASVTTATRALHTLDLPAPLPEWVPEHLQELAESANLTPDFDPLSFAEWAQHADTHLQVHGFIPRSDKPVHGKAHPATTTLAARHAQALQGDTPPTTERSEISPPELIEVPDKGVSL